jgi:hypothetical protein
MQAWFGTASRSNATRAEALLKLHSRRGMAGGVIEAQTPMLPPTFRGAHLVPAFRTLLTALHVRTLLTTLNWLFQQLPLLSSETHALFVDELILEPKLFFTLFCSWSEEVRGSFHSILVHRAIRTQRSCLAGMMDEKLLSWIGQKCVGAASAHCAFVRIAHGICARIGCRGVRLSPPRPLLHTARFVLFFFVSIVPPPPLERRSEAIAWQRT